MSDLTDGQQEPVFRVFTGDPTVTVAQVNAALAAYGVLAWNWAVCDGKVILSALLISLREVRKQQIALAAMPQIRPGG